MNNPTADKLHAALTDERGDHVPVTRIELVPLPGRFRWSLYRGDQQIFSAETEASPAEIHAATESAGLLIACAAIPVPVSVCDPERN